MKRILTLWTFLSVGIACLTAVAAGSTPSQPSRQELFNRLVAQAKANLETPAGREYDKVLSKHLEKNTGGVVKACFDAAAPKPDPSRFEVVLTILKDGKMRDVSVWPETNIALCVKPKMAAFTAPPPPSDGFLAYVEMTFEP